MAQESPRREEEHPDRQDDLHVVVVERLNDRTVIEIIVRARTISPARNCWPTAWLRSGRPGWPWAIVVMFALLLLFAAAYLAGDLGLFIDPVRRFWGGVGILQ